MDVLIMRLFYFGLCYAAAHFLGRKRQIGFGWSLFFCLFLTPITGFIITMLSPKYYDDNPAPSTGKKVTGWIMIILFSLVALRGFVRLGSGDASPAVFRALFLTIALVGAGAYLVGRGQGKSYNSPAIQPLE